MIFEHIRGVRHPEQLQPRVYAKVYIRAQNIAWTLMGLLLLIGQIGVWLR